MQEINFLYEIAGLLAAGTFGDLLSWVHIALAGASVLVFFMARTLVKFARDED